MKLILLALVVLTVIACVSIRDEETYSVEKGVVYKEIDGKRLDGDLYLPETSGKRPAMLVVHGGGWVSRSGDMEGISKRLAKAGFVVYNITYRLAPEHRHPAQLDDVSDALSWLYNNAERYQIDPGKIGGWGYSAGAHLILLAGLDRKSPPFLKSIVAGGTPADLTVWPKSPLVFELIGQSLAEAEGTWRDASPVNHVNKNSPPVFLYHGQWDLLVEPEQMNYMVDALEAAEVPVETYSVKWLGHAGVYLFAGKAKQNAVQFARVMTASD